jgi:hypothetical protein
MLGYEGLRWFIKKLEYQTVCPFVRIDSPRSLSRKRVCPCPLEPKGGGGQRQHSLAGEGVGEPIRTTREKATRLRVRGRELIQTTTGEKDRHSIYFVGRVLLCIIGGETSAGILEQSKGARNRVEIGLSYRPTRLHRLAEWISRNPFLGSLKV